MAEFIEVMEQRTRMCESHSENLMCKDCPLSFRNSSSNLGCHEFTTEYPRKAEEIIMKWAEEHPVQTNADKFKEVFGLESNKSCVVLANNSADYCESCKYKDEFKCYEKWWSEEYKVPKGEE